MQDMMRTMNIYAEGLTNDGLILPYQASVRSRGLGIGIVQCSKLKAQWYLGSHLWPKGKLHRQVFIKRRIEG